MPSQGDYYTYRTNFGRTLAGKTRTDATGLYTKSYSDFDLSGNMITTFGDSEFHYEVSAVVAGAGINGGNEVGAQGCEYRYSPTWYEIPATVTVGMAWQNAASKANANSSCAQSNLPVTVSVKGSAVGTETIDVAAGRFDTIKLVYQTIWVLKKSTQVNDVSCWRDVVSGMNVKCVADISTTPSGANGATTKATRTDELLGYATAATGRRKDVVERFAGTWTDVMLQSTTANDCVFDIGATGKFNATCSSIVSGNITVPISGSVNASGELSLTIDGQDFSGKGADGLQFSGQSKAGNRVNFSHR
ncbi:hypothetical protein DUGA2_23710 [Duganella sp. HH101]|nr:hypothetical protein DUGA2_23710 [Duganella sp. HH101]